MSHSWWLKQQSEYILHYVSQYPIPIYPHPSSTDNTLDLHFVFGGYVYMYMGVQHFVRYITLNPYQSFPLAHHKVLPVALHGDNDWTGWPFACGLGRRTGGCPRVKAVSMLIHSAGPITLQKTHWCRKPMVSPLETNRGGFSTSNCLWETSLGDEFGPRNGDRSSVWDNQNGNFMLRCIT